MDENEDSDELELLVKDLHSKKNFSLEDGEVSDLISGSRLSRRLSLLFHLDSVSF